MRDILFRGKRADNGEWVYGYYFKNDVTKQHYILKTGTGIPTMVQFKVISESVSQSTNLLDKNGEKIFEGDILYDAANGAKHYVRYYLSRFWWKSINYGILGDIDFPEDFVEYYEIIGNIHDNPELLEVEE